MQHSQRYPCIVVSACRRGGQGTYEVGFAVTVAYSGVKLILSIGSQSVAPVTRGERGVTDYRQPKSLVSYALVVKGRSFYYLECTIN